MGKQPPPLRGACPHPTGLPGTEGQTDSEVPPSVSPPVVAGPQSPVGPSPPPPHQHRFCLPSGPQTCPPLSRSLAPDVTCLPWTASSPLPSPRVSVMRLKCRRGHMAVSLTPSGSRASKAFPTHPEDLGRWQPHRALLTPRLSPPPHHGSLLPRCQASPCPRPGHSGPGACFSALCLRPRGFSQLPPSSWHLPSAQ